MIIVSRDVFGDGLSIDEYSNAAFEWAKIHITKTGIYLCPCLNAEIHISNKNIRHTIFQKKYDQQENYNHETISIINILIQIITNAELRYTGQDKYGSANVKCIKMLKAKVIIDGKPKEVELLIKEVFIDLESTKFVFYNHVLIT